MCFFLHGFRYILLKYDRRIPFVSVSSMIIMVLTLVQGEMALLKMFTTQLTGLYTRIMNKEEESFEDGARLLAQAAVGAGKIYLKGFGEMAGIHHEALHGAEPLPHAAVLETVEALSDADRVILFTRFSDDAPAVELAEKLIEHGVPFTAVSGRKRETEGKCLTELADVFIDTHLVKPMLPGEDLERIGFPSLMAALYIYHVLKFTLSEILAEYE